MKKLFALILVVCMVLSMAPVTAFAGEITRAHCSACNVTAEGLGVLGMTCILCNEGTYSKICNYTVLRGTDSPDGHYYSCEHGCAEISAVKGTVRVSELGHTYKEWSWSASDVDGEHFAVCTEAGCGYKNPVSCEGKGWEVNKSGNWHINECKTCGGPAAKAHKIPFDATCEGETGICGTCGLEYTGKASHTTEGENGREATCQAPAKCGKCGEEFGEKNPNNHLNPVPKDEVPATCNQPGNEAGTYCEYCEVYATGGQETINAGNHGEADTYVGDFVNDDAHALMCENCEVKVGEEAHADSAWFQDEAKVNAWKFCENCNSKYDEHKCEGGEATCQHQAVCDICNQPYGELKDHAFNGDYSYDNKGHWIWCDYHADGCTEWIGEGYYDEGGNHETYIVIGHTATECGEQYWDTYNQCKTCPWNDGEIKTLDHDIVENIYIAGDCTTPNVIVKTCTRCELAPEYVVEEEAAHAWDNGVVTTAPECGVKGVKTFTCSTCGATKTEDVKALEHDMQGTPVVMPGKKSGKYDCTKGYYMYQVCSKCGELQAPAFIEDSELSHVWSEEETIPATCTWKEQTAKKCTNPGCEVVEVTEREAVKNGKHAPIADCTLIGARAVCGVAGEYAYECPKCGQWLDKDGAEVSELQAEKALVHTNLETKLADIQADTHTSKCKDNCKVHDWTYVKATCQEYGYYTSVCALCGENARKFVDNKDNPSEDGHVWVEGDVLIAGDCGEGTSSWYTKVCSVCGAIDPDNYFERKTEHTYVIEVIDDIVCEDRADGWAKITCAKCDKFEAVECTLLDAAEYGFEYVKPAHVFTSTYKPADCENNAFIGSYCAHCGEKNPEVDEVEVEGTVLGHDLTIAAVGKNCLYNLVTVQECQREGCDYVVYNYNQAISGARHGALKKVYTTEKTCEQDGEGYYVCADCGAYVCENSAGCPHSAKPHTYPTYFFVEEAGHVYDAPEGVEAVEDLVQKANCTDEGYTMKWCYACEQYILQGKKIPAIEEPTQEQHKEWVVVEWQVEKTCTEDGIGVYGCKFCGAKNVDAEGNAIYEPVLAGHVKDEEVFEVIKPATCKEAGVANYLCAVCNAVIGPKAMPKLEAYEDHTFGWVTKESTKCTESIKTCWECLVCGIRDIEFKAYKDATSTIVNESNTAACKFGEPFVKEATCTENGGTYVKCSVCGFEKFINDTNKVPALKHPKQYQNTYNATEATCYLPGLKVTVCNLCGEIINEEPIAATGHGDDVMKKDEARSVASNCTVKGYNVYVCKNGCGFEKIEQLGLEVNEHVWKTVTVFATPDCKTKTPGVELQECAYCAGVNRYTTISWNTDSVHAWDEGVVTKVATCENDGEITYTCTKCEMTKTETVDALDHTLVTETIEADCEKGTRVATYCSVCEWVKEEGAWTTKPLGHAIVKTYIQPTCTEDGHWLYACERCDYEDDVEDENYEAKKLNHKLPNGQTAYEFIETVPATCKEKGYDLYVCSLCQYEDKRNTSKYPVDKKDGHNWEMVGEPMKEATCAEAGFAAFKCSICGEEQNRVYEIEHTWSGIKVAAGNKAIYKVCLVCGKIDVIASNNGFTGFDGCMEFKNGEWVGAHTLVIEESKEPDCTETGLIGTIYCSVCGEVLVAEEVIDALGHTEEIIPAVAATCTTDGLTEGKKCSVCNDILVAQEVVDGGHTEEIIPAVAADCKNGVDGLTEGKKCTVCGEVTLKQEVVKAAHTEVIIPAVAATCTTKGSTEGKECSVCGEVLVAVEETEMIAHTEVIVPGTPATEYAPGLKDGVVCGVCGLVIVEQEVIDAKSATLVVPAVLRNAGSDNADRVKVFYEGTSVTIEGPMNANGYYEVTVGGIEGWMHHNYLEIAA